MQPALIWWCENDTDLSILLCSDFLFNVYLLLEFLCSSKTKKNVSVAEIFLFFLKSYTANVTSDLL